MGTLDCTLPQSTDSISVGFVAGYDVVNVGCGVNAASRCSATADDDDCVDEDAVVDDGGNDGAGNGEPDGERHRQRDVRLPEEHAQPEGRPQRVAG